MLFVVYLQHTISSQRSLINQGYRNITVIKFIIMLKLAHSYLVSFIYATISVALNINK